MAHTAEATWPVLTGETYILRGEWAEYPVDIAYTLDAKGHAKVVGWECGVELTRWELHELDDFAADSWDAAYAEWLADQDQPEVVELERAA